MEVDYRAMLAWIGAAISLIGTLRYMQGILREGTRPRLASWFGWFAANAVLASVAVGNHAYQIAFFNGLAMLGNLAVLVMSGAKRSGERPNGIVDWMCLSSALVCLVVMIGLPHIAWLGAMLALGASAVATLPTIIHAWQKPHDETWQLFAANMLAGLLAVMSISGFKFESVAGPLIMTVANLSLALIATLRRPWVQQQAELLLEEIEEELGLKPREQETI